MKASEIRELSNAELNEKLTALKAELFNLRFQHAINQLENPMRMQEVKRHRAHQNGAASVGNEKRAVNEGRI